jgi:hypothetical protein
VPNGVRRPRFKRRAACGSTVVVPQGSEARLEPALRRAGGQRMAGEHVQGGGRSGGGVYGVHARIGGLLEPRVTK